MRKNFKKFFAVLVAAVLCLTATMGMIAQAADEVVYKQVTDVADVLDGGEFVIVAKYNKDGSGDKYYAMDDAKHAAKIDPKEVSVADGKVTGELPVWTVASMGTGISIKGDLGYMSYNKETKFKNATNGKAEDPYEWQLEAKEGGQFQLYWQGQTNRVVVGLRDYVSDGSNTLIFGPFPMDSVATSENIFVLELMFFEKTTVSGTPVPGPGIDDTADINVAPLYAVLVLGVAVVAFASKKRFA